MPVVEFDLSKGYSDYFLLEEDSPSVLAYAFKALGYDSVKYFRNAAATGLFVLMAMIFIVLSKEKYCKRMKRSESTFVVIKTIAFMPLTFAGLI